MIGQMIDIETFALRLEKKVEKYQQRYQLADSDVAWIFFRLGTSYYFKDICSRGLNGNGQSDNGGNP